MLRVLLIEQDVRIQELVRSGLSARGFSVTGVSDGLGAIELLRNRSLDVVLLDLTLPDVDGLALLTAIRRTRPRLPLIALTADGDMRSKLDAFSRGADDCVTKPFSLTELAARIHTRMRWRAEGSAVVEAGLLTLDLATQRAVLGGRSVMLSSRESALLATFLRYPGEVLARDDLLRLVWEIEFDPGSNVVDVYVAALRRKLGSEVIETVRGQGYRLGVGIPGGAQAESADKLVSAQRL
jgi:DNA-binding response OmpR family regulator